MNGKLRGLSEPGSERVHYKLVSERNWYTTNWYQSEIGTLQIIPKIPSKQASVGGENMSMVSPISRI
jgi:hypothetical protein